MDDREKFFRQGGELAGVLSASEQEIAFLDTAPRPIVVQIPLVDYFERIKRYKADRWQRDLCERLQNAAANRHQERYWSIIHAEAQLGKTSIISQCFPAWLIGHDPQFRFALAMYNVTRSQAHSGVVIQIMNSNIHKDLFPNKDGWIYASQKDEFGNNQRGTSKAGWLTNARKEINDGQLSFNPVGLQSGLTGSGFDWLGIDDPYREAKEAFSSTIRENMTNFWDYTVMSRVAMHSCVTGMFHRYAPEDFAGFLLDTGDFDYVRYASVCDGDYVHASTGLIYADPLGRKEGEYIAPDRRPASYYAKIQKNKRVWMAMFQGKPSDEEGEFFNVGRLGYVPLDDKAVRRAECVAMVRSYDQAATNEAGAYSVGALMGIRPDGRVTVFNVWRERVDASKRLQRQQQLAFADGEGVTIKIPQDPGSAGKFEAWATTQQLEGFNVVAEPVSGSKEMRAMNLAAAVNSGEVDFVEDHDLDLKDQWVQEAKREMRDFPLSEYKDIVDAMSDGYNYLFKVFRQGLVVKNFKPQRHLISFDNYGSRFHDDQKRPVVPDKWTLYFGIKPQADASRPTCGVAVARASVKSDMPEQLFVLDEYRSQDASPQPLIEWMDGVIKRMCPDKQPDVTIWLHPDATNLSQLINQKTRFRVNPFQEDDYAGISELNWYLLPKDEASPFVPYEKASSIYFLTDRDQLGVPVKGMQNGFYYVRQEMASWGFDDRGKPAKNGGVLDCLRMITYKFRTYAEPLTLEEEYEMIVTSHLKKAEEQGLIPEGEMTKERQQHIEFARQIADVELTQKYGSEDEDPFPEDDFEYPF